MDSDNEYVFRILNPNYKPDDKPTGDGKWIIAYFIIAYGILYLLGSLGDWLF
jgi:hypothetical protein